MTKNLILGVLLFIAVALGVTAFWQAEEHRQMAIIAQVMAMEKSKQAEMDEQRLTAITDSLSLALRECKGLAEK